MSEQLKLEGIFSKGYGIIPKLVMKDKRLTIEAKSIYSYLCSYAGAGDTAFPSISLTCGDLGISENRYLKHRKMLIDFGYIKIGKSDKKQGWSNNVYTIVHSIYLQNECIQNECIQNEGTINNSSNNNSFKIKDTMSSKLDDGVSPKNSTSKGNDIPYTLIIEYLNQKSGKNFRNVETNKKLIRSRWNEGYRLDDFKTVVDVKVKEWNDSKDMNKYVRPSTLFNNKFDGYLNEAPKVVSKKKGVSIEDQMKEDGLL